MLSTVILLIIIITTDAAPPKYHNMTIEGPFFTEAKEAMFQKVLSFLYNSFNDVNDYVFVTIIVVFAVSFIVVVSIVGCKLTRIQKQSAQQNLSSANTQLTDHISNLNNATNKATVQNHISNFNNGDNAIVPQRATKGRSCDERMNEPKRFKRQAPVAPPTRAAF